MKWNRRYSRLAAIALLLSSVTTALAQAPNNPLPPDGPPGFDGPPPAGGPGGFMPGGPGGFGGMNQPETKLIAQFDKDGDKRLNNAERKAARESLSKQGNTRRGGGPGGPGGRRGRFGPPGESAEATKPGPRVSPTDVKSYPDASLYASNVLRTFFLEFENADWEKELEDFHNTDVEVPARLTVDGKSYPDVGIHFRGASSYMMLGTGQKRSLNLTLDFADEKQDLDGYRTLNLLNSHGDPTFLRAVLYYDIARAYLPAPKANLVRLVVNGESWGVYVNVQQFNKDFVKEWFDTKKGARWKVPGSPNGRGSLAYLGDDSAAYKKIYEIKSKDDDKSWADFIQLCKVLNETPADKLETALSPLLDIDGALKFLALENALINNDGYWVRTSDYDIYQDEKRRFHVLPYDANETFSLPGGPGFGGGPGGPGGFGPGMMLAPQILDQADKNEDGKLTKDEFAALADAWFDKLDPEKSGKVTQEQFIAKLPEILPPPPGMGGFGPAAGGGQGARNGRGGFGPAMFIGPGLFGAVDANKDGSLARTELKDIFAKWFGQWDADKTGTLQNEQLRAGLNAVLPAPSFGGPGGGQGGRGGQRGPGGMARVNGVELDPLVAANDASKPLISKLLAVPSLRARYLAYVREIAETWLDWKNLGPRVQQYQALISDEVKADTRKLSSFEAFQKGVASDAATGTGSSQSQAGSLKSFADQRRAYLLKYTDMKKP